MKTESVPLVTTEVVNSRVQTWLPLRENLSVTVQHFVFRLRETPLLTVCLILGLLIAFFLDGWRGLMFGLINLALIAVYALLIRFLTPDPPAPVSVKRPPLGLALAIGLFGLFLLVQLLDFGVWNIQPLQGSVRMFFNSLRGWVSGFAGDPYLGAPGYLHGRFQHGQEPASNSDCGLAVRIFPSQDRRWPIPTGSCPPSWWHPRPSLDGSAESCCARLWSRCSACISLEFLSMLYQKNFSSAVSC